MVSTSESKVDSTISEFYESISFGLNSSPDYERMSKVFVEHATICVPDRADKIYKAMTVSQFIEFAKISLWAPSDCRDGFVEEEISGETKILTSIAHRFSKYRCRSMTDDKYFSKGTNSFHLVLKDDDWKIVSLTWERNL